MARARWDERYRAEELVWSLRPNQFLVDETRVLRRGRALDVGTGEGRNAVWLAQQGWRVTAVDFSAVGLDKARQRARRERVDVEWIEADLAEYVPPASTFDLIAILYLHLPPAERRIVHQRMSAALAPGGTILVVGHHVRNLTEGVGGPGDPTLLFTPQDIVHELVGVRIERAEQVVRHVTVEGGTADAIDALVRAVRAAPSEDASRRTAERAAPREGQL